MLEPTKDKTTGQITAYNFEAGQQQPPIIGQRVKFGSHWWEVASVEKVTCDYDPDYLFRVDLIIRDETGRSVNFATGIPNYCLDAYEPWNPAAT